MITLANDVQVRLADDLLDTDTSLMVDEAVNPMNNPPEPPDGESAVLTLVDQLAEPTQIEIVTYTTVTDNQDGTFTIGGLTRGQEGTAAQPFNSGAWAFQSATVAILLSLLKTRASDIVATNAPFTDALLQITESGEFRWVDPETLEPPELSISGISPDQGLESGGTVVTITGVGFSIADFGGADSVTINGVDLVNPVVVSNTEISGQTPPGVGIVDVAVNIGGQTATLAGGFSFGELWTLAEIETAYWLESDDSGDTIVDGSGNLSQWGDKSGNGNHASQATGSAQPELVENVQNGLAVARFGGDDWLQIAHDASLNHGNNVTLVCLNRVTTTTGRQNIYVASDDETANSLWIEKGTHTSTPPSTDGYSAAVPGDFISAISNVAEDDEWDILVVSRVDADTHSWHVNGEDVSSDDDAPGTIQDYLDNARPKVIGTRNATGSQFFVGDMGLLALIPEVIDQATKDKIVGSTFYRWGLQDKLPPGHPYKENPPIVVNQVESLWIGGVET